jgi:hypothetical protein
MNASHPTHTSGGTDTRWTPERIRGLGSVTDIVTAGAILGLSRSVAYDLAARGEFPTPVLRAGTRYRVPVPALLTTLGIPVDVPAGTT